MGTTSTPTCLHCGNAIDRPDKPFCSKCGQYWALSTRAHSRLSPLPIQLPTFTDQNETATGPLAPGVSASSWSQMKNDLLRVSMQMQQQGIFPADEPREARNTFSQFNKPLSTSPLTSEELREKLRMLQEKMQIRTEVQENRGLPGPTLEVKNASSSRLSPVVLRAALTQDELLHKLRGLRAQASEDQTYTSPGTEDANLAEIAPVWRYQLERIHKSIDFLVSTQGEPEREREIRQHLSEALRQLDVTRSYHITLVDYAENGTSVLLAALLGEDIFLRQFGIHKSGIRIVVRSSQQTEQEKMYVHFQDESQPAKAFFRKEWLEVWSDPDYLSPKPSQTAIHSLEFALHTSLLPPGSLIVLLPQGELFKAQFEADIAETDVLILVVDGTRPNYGPMRRLVEQIRPYLLQERSPDHSARMFFLAATYQNRIDTTEDLEITTSNLRSLLPFLPAHYEHHHHHGAGKNYFFYPLWVMDAFFATSGMKQRAIAPDLQIESQQYVERLQASYEKIQGLFPTLPPTCEATTFHEISFEQHEAMLRMSNLPELSQDLGDFLRDVRLRIQLSYARNAIQRALQMLEDFAWEQLRPHYSVPTYSLETLEEVLNTREQRRKVERRHYITQRITVLKNAWEEALVHFEMATLNSEKAPSRFHNCLEQAHSQAVNVLVERIRQGHFDSYLEHNGSPSAPTWSIDHLGHEVHLRRLLGKMRSALHVALEAELEQAAQELAQTFLQTLQKSKMALSPLLRSVRVFAYLCNVCKKVWASS